MQILSQNAWQDCEVFNFSDCKETRTLTKMILRGLMIDICLFCFVYNIH